MNIEVGVFWRVGGLSYVESRGFIGVVWGILDIEDYFSWLLLAGICIVSRRAYIRDVSSSSSSSYSP